MSEKVYFYMNNPCVIIRDINDEFAEIRLSHHFAGDMQLTGQCEACCVGDIDNKLSCTCDEHSWIIEEIQDEENLLLVLCEKRLLTESPAEHLVLVELQKDAQKELAKLNETKKLHEEWRLSLKAQQAKFEALSASNNALKLEIAANLNLKERSENGLKALNNKYEQMLVAVGYIGDKRITQRGYDNLIEKSKILDALKAGGVSNWEWYEKSLENAKCTQ